MNNKKNNKITQSLHIVKTAGGRSIFLTDGKYLYKKDASGKECELYGFYNYLEDKPDLKEKFPIFYGLIKIPGTELGKLINNCRFDLYDRAKEVKEINYLICMENMYTYFKKKPWVLDIKLAAPKTSEKYHNSRVAHEFSIHGIRAPGISYDHKEHRNLNYDDLNDVSNILSGYFPNTGLINRLIKEIKNINKIFKIYSFDFNCSLLIIHDTNKLVVRVIDCSLDKSSHRKSGNIKRIDFFIRLLQNIKKLKLK